MGLFQQLYGWLGAWIIIFWSIIKFFLPAQKKSLAGEIVLVTGAGSGIGRLMSINFAKLGSTLVIWDINKDGADETVKQITDLGGQAHSYRCDVTKKDEVYRLAKQVKNDVGDVTILVNNAGIVAGRRFLDCPDELVERTMEVNAMSIFWTLKAFLPSMVAKNHGHLVTVASMAGTFGSPFLVEYCASKFAAVGVHEALTAELSDLEINGVQTTLVQPFFIATGMFDGVKTGDIPMLEPDYVADKVVHAVQVNQRQLCIPKIMYFIAYFKTWMPVNAYIFLAKATNSYRTMDNYTGREKKAT
ncbi:epidermal retinol dehydrogenase 2-like [Saccoglossus kowalevskii]|uniref:Epidermal retinol dehydrogenase 2-like n=1 Tax=Saccoglossus kowalevskii TaxID=10224 RepID=A0ABM0GGV3_SACKO|nr:epidermal retinol dehydrogenase 2-like [Saccoglossus kowalevskii]